MDCLIWEWSEVCKDIPNYHALMWELIAGAGIAFGVWFWQYRKTSKRKTHSEEEIIILLGNIRDTARTYVKPINDLLANGNYDVSTLELPKSFKEHGREIDDIINTSFDVVDGTVLDQLRQLKSILNSPLNSDMMDIAKLGMIENDVTLLFLALEKTRLNLIKKKRNNLQKFLKELVPVDAPKEQSKSVEDMTNIEINKISIKEDYPDSVFKKSV